MATSQNGFPVLAADSPRLYTWTIPTREGDVRLRLRNGSAGFLICHLVLWYADRVEPLIGRVLDDWGYASRPVRGSSRVMSNHASGTAADVNATEHGLGTDPAASFSRLEIARIRLRLKLYRGALRWGGDYRGRKDPMHFEINAPLGECERVARRLVNTPRGRKILAANPGQRKVIFS